MFTEYLYHIKHDFVLLSLITFAIFYGIYALIVRLHLSGFIRKNSKKPMHFKMFRLYSSSLVNNAPSKKEKLFYIAANKITLFFNSLTIIIFVIYLFICFK